MSIAAPLASAGRLDPTAQFHQMGESLRSLFTSLCESTDSAFQRVHVQKRNENGNIKLYDRKDPVTGQVTKVGVLTYIEDVKTGDLYLDEPEYIIAFKCALTALGMPLYTVGKMAWHIVKTPFEIGAIALETIFKIGQNLAMIKLYEAVMDTRRGFTQIIDVLGNGVYEIIKAPVFGLGCELAAIYGIVKPFHGKKYEALIENAWQSGASYKDDFRNIKPRPNENCWEAFRKDVASAHPFYLAQCFQVRGNTHSPRIVVIRRESF